MAQRLDLERLRDAHGRLIERASPEVRKARKDALNNIRGLLLVNGLLHALFAGRKAPGSVERDSQAKDKQADEIFQALADWLISDTCMVGTMLKGKMETVEDRVSAFQGKARVNQLAEVLMTEYDIAFCMAVQSEAIRYLGQVKLLIDAYDVDEQKSGGQS